MTDLAVLPAHPLPAAHRPRSAEQFLIVCDYALDYLGGAQTALVEQAHALAAAGHEVTLVAPRASAQRVALESAGIEVVEPSRTVTLPGLDLPMFRASAHLVAQLARLLDARRPRAVLLHSEFGLASAALEAAQARGIPVLHTVHTFFWRGPAAARLLAPGVRAFHRVLTGYRAPFQSLADRPFDSALRGMTWSVARQADLVLSPSAHQADALRRAGIRRVRVLSNTTRTDPITIPFLPPVPLRLAWIGRFAPEKRLDVALDAVARVTSAIGHGRIRLDVAGGAHAPTEGAVVHGRLPHAEVRRVIARSHAVVVTSHGFDNQPMVALEAFALGRPVIVSDPVLAREFGEAAILASDPTAEGLGRTLASLVEDPGPLLAAADAAARWGMRRTPAAHVAAIRSALDELERAYA